MNKNTDLYIGSAKEYRPGDIVRENIFFEDIELAKASAQNRANESGLLFGMVYAITHDIEEADEMAMRVPQRILRFVDWSL